jgi:hypothetical protein
MENAMAVNATLYVRDEDAAVWDRAKEVIGESLSSYLTSHLRSIVNSDKAAANGNERILLRFRENSLPKQVAFNGKWIIAPEARFFQDDWDESRTYFALAITAHNRVAVFRFDGQKEDGTFPGARLTSYDTFEMANMSSDVPSELIANAMEIRGIPVEELDI